MSASRGIDLGLMKCRICGHTMRQCVGESRCPRCHRVVSVREPASREKTLAWLITGVILYLPANILPVLHTRTLLGREDSTILDGILGFVHAGSWDIAALIFIASVVVPVTKFLSLGVLLWTAQKQSDSARRQRTKRYKFVEFIGYWSMLDVVVVAITSTLLHLKSVANAEPGVGIVFFCGVVMTTMMAALSFDPRLIWDAPASTA